MNLIAAITAPLGHVSTLDKLRAIPPEFWMRLGFAVLAVIGTVLFLRQVVKMNKVVLTVVVGLMVTIVGFNWVYQRNEPTWATPVVSFLSGFFPTQGPHAKAATPPHAMAKRS
jgi:hypothetical protein